MKAIPTDSASGISIILPLPSHATALAQLVTQDHAYLQEFLPAVTRLDTADRALAHIQAMQERAIKGELLEWHLFSGDTLCGSIRLRDINTADRKAKIGYFIASAFQGRGIATTATRAVLAYAFNSLDLNRVELQCVATNLPSMRVAERLGFTREGVLRQEECLNGVFADVVVYGLLHSEFNSQDRKDAGK